MSSKITVSSSKLTVSLLLVLFLAPIARAQSDSGSPADPADDKQAREERQKKVLALVDEIMNDAASLKLPENRIRISMRLAASLWPLDENRARLLINKAAKALAEIAAAPDVHTPESLNLIALRAQLRQEILSVAAAHDPELALDLLQATRPAAAQQLDATLWRPDPEAQLEMGLAVQMASRDPGRALVIGQHSLKTAIDYQALTLLYGLQNQDKASAGFLLDSILNRLRQEDFSKNAAASSVAMSLFNGWAQSRRQSSEANYPQVAELRLPNFDERKARELCDLLLKTAMSGRGDFVFVRGHPSHAVGIMEQLKQVLPDVDRLSPNQSSALRKLITEYEKANELQRGAWGKYDELFRTGDTEALLEASRTAPGEIADRLIHQAAWKAMNDGDLDGAKRIAEKITDRRQRFDLNAGLDRQAFYHAREQKRLGEARMLLARLPSVEEQVTLLTQMAAFSAGDGDKSGALQLLGEAEALLGDRAANYSQLVAQLQIANHYFQFDPGTSASIVEKVIGHLNELSVAAAVLNGFDVQQYFREGEMIIGGGNQLNMAAQQSADSVGMIAGGNFERSKSLADMFERPEMRIMALLQITQAALSSLGR